MSTFELDGGNVIGDDDNNNGTITIEIDPHQATGAASDLGNSTTTTQLTRLLFSVGFLTLLMDVATALYKPPQGVVFERHRLAYYLTLAGIFAAGLVEVFTAFCLSSSGQTNKGRLVSFARVLLCTSVAPLVVVVALGGFSVLMKN